jgi:C4-dicarboxylate-specific signal transduction histidine kinase
MDLHARLTGLAWLLIAVVVGAVFVYPLFFRQSLAHPLDRLLQGVQRVAAGDLSTPVSVTVHDEIGRLTEHFNTMTASLRAYRDEMESLVDERTAALDRSIEELKTTQQQLIQQEKLASLGQLTAGIAHEIKNPLNFVTNFADIAQELADELRETVETGDDAGPLLDELTQSTAAIAQHSRRADAIVKGMMAHAHSSSGERRAVDLNALVEEHVALAYHGRRARTQDFSVQIEQAYATDVGEVEVVPQHIGRVVLNLVGNAFDAVVERSEEAGAGYTPTVSVVTQRSGDEVVVRVSDNGPGVPDALRSKIFEPFFTTKPTGSGTGLGLSLSYDIVTQGHGGHMSLGDVSEGAAFVVTLPG